MTKLKDITEEEFKALKTKYPIYRFELDNKSRGEFEQFTAISLACPCYCHKSKGDSFDANTNACKHCAIDNK